MPISRTADLVIKPDFCVFLALLFLVLPFPWAAAWFGAAAFHELCHLIVLRICNVNVYSLTVSFCGAEIKTEPMEPICELLASAAGPVGGFLLLTLLRAAPAVSLCALAQSVYNLLPLYPLDGGRILNCCVSIVTDKPVISAFLRMMPALVSLLILVFSVIAAIIWEIGMIPVVAAVILSVKNIHIKFPCKADKQIVQ